MMKLIWANGRFAWPFVVLITLLAASAVALDYSWRVLVMPLSRLLIWAGALEVIILGSFVVIVVRTRSRL